MQLFGLCNTLLDNDSESFKRHLSVQRFPAIPLSQSSGMLGWVCNSDTLHALIKEYRESRRILLNIEHRIMLQMAPDYDSLTLMQKVEVFGYAMDNTTGKDLYRVLWLKSKSSEAWLERRTNYTRSLGVMSMVGYILGLGDRHPSNLLLDRTTGHVVHVDFGDCFEVAMHREKYPERVPFRLTRMLTFAMEVSNIEGSYRITCEAVMRVLRENNDSLMAVLEAVSPIHFLDFTIIATDNHLVHSRPFDQLASRCTGIPRPRIPYCGASPVHHRRYQLRARRTAEQLLSSPTFHSRRWHSRHSRRRPCRSPRSTERSCPPGPRPGQGEADGTGLQALRRAQRERPSRQAPCPGHECGEYLPALDRLVQFLVNQVTTCGSGVSGLI